MDDVGQTPDQPSISRNARIELNAAPWIATSACCTQPEPHNRTLILWVVPMPVVLLNRNIATPAPVSALGSLLSNPVIQLVESRYAWALLYGG